MIKITHLLILTFLLASLGCQEKNEVITPKRTNIVESIYASGIVKSKNQYEVFTKITGNIKVIFVKEGDHVKKGDPLFQIDNVNSALTAENARISAYANDYLQNKEKLDDAKNQVDFAQKKLMNDSLQWSRQKKLWSQNIGSKSELEQRALNYENSKANLSRANALLKDIQRQLKLVSDQSKNNLKIAQATANDHIIRSEVDGIVYKINSKIGELATSVSPLATIGEDDFVIELNVDEYDIVKIKKGQKIVVKMDSYAHTAFEAEISFIYPIMNERTRSFKVEALFVRKPEILYPNLSLEANIVLREKKDILTIPSDYIEADSTVTLENGSKKKIGLGLSDFQLTEVISGINETEKIRLPKK